MTAKTIEFNQGPSRMVDFFVLFYLARWRILIVSFFCAALAFGISFLVPRQYASTVSFVSLARAAAPVGMTDRGESALLSVLSMASGGAGASNNALYIAILQSVRVRDAVARKEGLGKRLGLGPDEAARGWLAKHTFFREIKGGIVELRVTSPIPEVAYQVAADYVSELNSILNTVTLTQAQKQVNFLEGRIANVQQELSDTKNETNFRIKEMLFINLMKELEISKANAAKERIDVQILDSPELAGGHYFPNTKIFILIGFFLGILFSAIWILIRSGLRTFANDPYNAIRLREMRSRSIPQSREKQTYAN